MKSQGPASQRNHDDIIIITMMIIIFLFFHSTTLWLRQYTNLLLIALLSICGGLQFSLTPIMYCMYTTQAKSSQTSKMAPASFHSLSLSFFFYIYLFSDQIESSYYYTITEQVLLSIYINTHIERKKEKRIQSTFCLGEEGVTVAL